MRGEPLDCPSCHPCRPQGVYHMLVGVYWRSGVKWGFPFPPPSAHSTLDDEDEMLYGSSTVDMLAPVKAEPMDSAKWVGPGGTEDRHDWMGH